MRNNIPKKRKKIMFGVFMLVLLLIIPIVVMLLWNAILPDLLSVNSINYLQAFGLFVLCRILFGGFRFGPRVGRNGKRPPFAKRAFREKFMDMSEEEKATFKEGFRNRCRPKD